MNAHRLDTLRLAAKPKEAGVESEQAEGVRRVVADEIVAHVPTVGFTLLATLAVIGA